MILARYLALYVLFLLSLQAVGYSPVQGGKTENYTDSNGFRQGYWKILGALTIEDGYKDAQLVEEGEYVDNKRTGLWKKYYPTGSIRSEITYSENHPFGYYKVYYLNGKVEEEGYWKGNKNTGEFKRYYENGRPAQVFNFNSKGKREGEQKYYYPNGKVQLVVELENGIAHGEYKAFYPDGKPKEEKRYVNGEVEKDSERKFDTTKEYKDSDTVVPELSEEETTPAVSSDKPNLAEFKENGMNTLYNRNRQLSQVGEFKDGRLYDGKRYRYDENGLLKKVEVYKEGKFIGYGIIEETNY